MKLFQIFNKSTPAGQTTKAPTKSWRGKVYQATPAKTRDTAVTADLRQVLSQRANLR